MLTPDPRPTSFQNHPGLRDREPEARELADVLRRLIRLSVSAAPPAAETVRLTARLAALADELETHLPADPLPRFMPPDEDGPPKDVPLGGAMPYDVVVGPFNPVALPVVLDFEPPKALGRGTFDVTYEGAPGCVHGAVLAAAFDIILTAANAIEGSVGPTVSLALRYLRPTLTNEEAVFEGWVTEVTDRRIFSKGRIVQGGVVTVEAEGEFAIFNQDRVNRMATGRRRSFDAGTGSAALRPVGGGVARGPWPASPWSPHATQRTIRSPTACAPASPRPTPWASSTMRRTCRISRRHGSSTSGPSDTRTTPCAAGNRTTPENSRCSRSRCGTASRCASTTTVEVSLRIGAVRGATFQIAYLLTVGGEARATAVTVHGCVDGRGRPARLPAWVAGSAVDGDD